MQTLTKALAFLSFLFKKESPYTAPAHLLLEPTSSCNLHCAFCPYSVCDDPVGGHGFMEPALMERILGMVRKNPPVAGVSLHLGGEPLMHPEIDSLVGLVHRHLGKRPRIASNGTLLTEALSHRIVRAGGAHLEIDFCRDMETFRQLRAGADWDVVNENISRAISAGLEMSLIALDGNVEELRSLFGDNPRIAYGHFRLHNCGGKFASTVEERFAIESNKRRYFPCTHLWFSMAVAWNGKVVLCCRDILHQHVVGDLMNESISQVWRGPDMRYARRLHAKADLDSLTLCRSCDRPWDPYNHPATVIRRYSPRWKP